jgi:hypothetical protein
MPQKTIFGQASVQRVFGSGCHSASRDGQEGVLAMAAASPPDLTSLARPIPNGSKLSATEGDRDALFWLCSNAGVATPSVKESWQTLGLSFTAALSRGMAPGTSLSEAATCGDVYGSTHGASWYRLTQLHLPVPRAGAWLVLR